MSRGFWSRNATAAAFLAIAPVAVLADGTETLGPPSIDIAEGTSVLAAGAGTVTQPGVINLDVPAGATVEQVLLYWNQYNVLPDEGDDTVSVNGQPVTGDLIGGPTTFFFDVSDTVHRADITSLGLVAPGSNELSITDLDTSWPESGAGILVVIDEGGAPAHIDVRDGSDLAYWGFQPPRDTTELQEYTFEAADVDRESQIVIFAGSIENLDRPTAIEVTIDGEITTYWNMIGSVDGLSWDTLILEQTIPAGVTSLTVHIASRPDGSGNDPAAFTWIGSTLSIAGVQPPDPVGDEGCNRYFWLFSFYEWFQTPYRQWDDFDAVFGVDFHRRYMPMWSVLLRHTRTEQRELAQLGVIALLNASHPDIDFPLTEEEVIATVQAGDIQTLRDLRDIGLTCPLESGGNRW